MVNQIGNFRRARLLHNLRINVRPGGQEQLNTRICIVVISAKFFGAGTFGEFFPLGGQLDGQVQSGDVVAITPVDRCFEAKKGAHVARDA